MTGFDRFNTKAPATPNKASAEQANTNTANQADWDAAENVFGKGASQAGNANSTRRNDVLRRLQQGGNGPQAQDNATKASDDIARDLRSKISNNMPRMDAFSERNIRKANNVTARPYEAHAEQDAKNNIAAQPSPALKSDKAVQAPQAQSNVANKIAMPNSANQTRQGPVPVPPQATAANVSTNRQLNPAQAQANIAQANQTSANSAQVQAGQGQANRAQQTAQARPNQQDAYADIRPDNYVPPSGDNPSDEGQQPSQAVDSTAGERLKTGDSATGSSKKSLFGWLKSLFGGKNADADAHGEHDAAADANDQAAQGDEKKWEIKPSFQTKDDPLLGCLLILCKLLDRSTTEESLLAELPVGDGQVTPDLFVRAAEREDIAAKLVNRKLSSISNLVLPCVVLLKGKRAGVLVSLKHGKEATLIMPDSKEGEQKLTWKELQEHYTNYSIFARPQFRYDKRASDMNFVQKPRGWFWGAVFNLWPIYAEIILASFIVNLLMIIGPLFMMNVYDRVIPHFAFDTLYVLAIGVAILLIFQFTLMMIRAFLIELAGKAVHTRISSRLFQQLMGLKMSERGDSTGTMVEKINGLDNVRQFFTSQTALSVIDLPFSFMFLVIIWILAGPIAIVPTSIIVVLLLFATFMGPVTKRFTRQQQEEKQHGRAIMVETIYGMETIKSTGAESRLQKDWELFTEKNSTTQMSSQNSNQTVMSLMMVSMQVNMVLIALFGVFMIKEGTLTMGGLLAANMLSMRAISPMMRVAGVAMRLHQSIVSLKQIQEIMQKDVERPLGSNFVHRNKIEGSIEFKNVSFTYPGQENKALDDVSFKIEKGEKIGVIGRIGSGKSTIERLILGLYEVDEGAVLVDGIDTRQIDPAELRRNVGTVPQDVFLFYGTLRENIALHAPYADDDMVLRAAHIAGVDEFVARHPQGMDMQVGEKGQNLSGGQRQAVSVARAFLVDPPIMLLDEPTAAMDTTTENRFKARLANLMDNRTLILMTHRFSLLTIIDRLIVVDNSKIVADGPKDRVLDALRNGTIQSVDV